MDKTIFFTEVRSKLFSGKLTEVQVNGIEAILSAAAHLPAPHVAYCLATAYHETGRVMAGNRESMDYDAARLQKVFGSHRITKAQAEKYGRAKGRPADQRMIANIVYGGAWGKNALGNTQPNDGWDFRGGGQAHVTGRANYMKVKKATGVDVIKDSNLICQPKVAATSLVTGSEEGWFTGHKLSDFLSGDAGPNDYVKARRIINGSDEAEKIAGYAKVFESALRQAKWSAIPHKAALTTNSGLLALITVILQLFKRK